MISSKNVTRRDFLATTGVFATSFILGGCSTNLSIAQPSGAKKPNILWLTIEDTSLFFGCYGDKVAKTPNVDQLAREGTLFTNAFASSPVCSPARSALISGMYVGELGVGNHRSVVKIPDFVKGYPHYLKKVGYYCTNHTKTDYNFADSWHWARKLWDDTSNSASWRNRKPDQPFFHVENYVDSHQSRTSVNSYARFKKNIQSQLKPEQITSPDEVVLPSFYTDSPRVRKAYARMYDCITLVDTQIGEKLQQLKDDGLYEDTIIFFYPDHGAGMPRFKTTPLDLGYRVPLVVRVPEKYRSLVNLKPGSKCDKIISFVDLGPTVLNIAGAEIPDYMSGLPILGPNEKEKKFFFGSANDIGATEQHSRSVYDGRYIYIKNYMPHLSYTQSQRYCDGAELLHFMREDKEAGILSPEAAYYMSDTRPPEELYDLKNDNWEVHNLADKAKYNHLLKKMRKMCHDKVLEIRDLHFLRPWEIETRAGDSTPCEIRGNEDIYPLNKILAIAELAGMGKDVLPEQIAALSDKEPMVRYWALIGLQSQDWKAPDVFDRIKVLMDDNAPYVRYEAAKLVYAACKDAKAKQVLIDGLNEKNCINVVNAIRKIRQLDKDAVDFISNIDNLEKIYKTIPEAKDKHYDVGATIADIRFCLAGEHPTPIDSF